MNHAQLQKWKRKISVAGPVVQAEKAFGTGSYTVDRTVNLDELGRPESSSTNLRTTTSTFDDSETGIGMSLGVIRTGEANITNAFDSAGNRVQMIKDQERTRTAFDSLSRIASQFVISVNSVSDSIIRTYKGKETSSIDESLATTIRTTNASTGISTVQSSKPYTPEHSISMSSDYLGRTKSRTETGLGTSTYIHDIYSNLLSETDAFGRTQSWIRDAFDRVISHTNFAGQTTTWTYDAWGNVLSQTDPNSLSTSYTYDERSRVLSVTDADGGVTTTVYDVKGRKISLTTPDGQTTSWTYDIYDRVLTETNALTQTKTFGYDAADRKTKVIKPDGNKIQYTYGNGSNPTKEEWLVGTNVIETLNFQYDAVGKMTSASDSATSLEFTYTDGLLSREKQTLAPSIIAQSDYIYAGGQVREVSLKLGASATFDSKVSYTYTANGQVATLQQTGPTTDTKSIRYSYDQAGNRVRSERFSDVGYATPIFETLSSYTNAQGQLKPTVQSIKHQQATGTVLASYDFVWDAGNRLSSMTSSADGLTTYSYTPTNQLSAIDYANAPDQSFTYDLNGNRTGSGNVTGADNRLTSNATWDFVYDANGNMTRRTLKSDNSYIEYTYDHRDRLTDVRYRTSAGTLTKRVHFGYDTLNRRYLQTVENGSGTILSTVYYVNQGFRKDRGDAGDEIALRLDGTGAVISRYLHGSLVDEVLAEENIGSGGARDVLWAMTDHQGSVRDLARVTAGTASVVNHIVYDAFGKTVSETDAAIAHLYGYTGRELDKETGLQYTRTRYLDLVLARFISQDPKSFAAGDTNLYRYVGNHPSYASDPSGLEVKDGYTITRVGHHIIPAELWKLFGFDPAVALIFDRDDNRVGKEFAGDSDKRHNRLGHGETGYTGHVKAELNSELDKFMKRNKITDGKLSIQQQERFAEDFANHLKHHTKNEYIRGFNESITDGGRRRLKEWLDTTGNSLPKPATITRLVSIKGVASLSIAKFAGKAIVQKGVRLVLAPAFAYWAYNEARANGASHIDAAGLAAVEQILPPGISKAELDAMEKRYREAVETAARAGRGVGNPEDFAGTILGPGFIAGRKQLFELYRELKVVDDMGNNIGGTRNSWDRPE